MGYLVLIIIAVVIYIYISKKKDQSTDSNCQIQTEYPSNVSVRITTHSSPPSRSQSVHPDTVWIPQGKSVNVAGFTINGGFIYVGSGLSKINGYGIEPALINPTLPIDASSPDREGENMRYWPSYSDISPSSRSAYLEWLASGRNRPDAYIGYVFLYFYGLERRALADVAVSQNATRDIFPILNEVKRLIAVYGANGSFYGYATNFYEAIRAKYFTEKLYKVPPPEIMPGYELPLSFKVGLGQLAVDGLPLPAEWAAAWVENQWLRTPAKRCREEFRNLFKIRYQERFKDGCKLAVNKTKLKTYFRPASSSFGGQIEFDYGDIPDVTAVKQPFGQLCDLAYSCTDELDAYSRYMGRNNDKENSIEACAFLPDCLIDSVNNEDFQMLKSWIAECFNEDDESLSLVDLPNLLSFFPSIETVRKRDAVTISQVLSKLGIGMEPDVRFGSPCPKTEKIALFRLPQNSPDVATSQYSAAMLILQLGAFVADADGTVSKEEEKQLEGYLSNWLDLSDAEKIRLRAYIEWLLSAPLSFVGLKKKLEGLSKDKKEAVGKFLITIALADGIIDPEEIKILDKIYQMLGLDSQQLYSQTHSAATVPVTVQPGEKQKQGYAIPPKTEEEKTSKKGVVLDKETIEHKLKETEEVTALLKNIFAEDEPLPEQPMEKAKPDDIDKCICGLDEDCSMFMLHLTQKSEWSREELESIADTRNLLLDGVLDTINEASFDTFNEPFFEGDDPIEINSEVSEEIQK